MENLANMFPAWDTSLITKISQANVHFHTQSRDGKHSDTSSETRSPLASGKQTRPRYLNTPNYPGTSVPRLDYTPTRQGFSPTLGKRLRQSKVFESFPRISDDTPPTTPTNTIQLQKRPITPAEQQLTNLLTASQPQDSLNSTPDPPGVFSPTTERLAHFRSRPANSNEEIEVVDLRPDLLPNSPSRYVYNSLEAPPLSPDSGTSEEGFFSSLVAPSNRASAIINPSTTVSSSGLQRKEQMAHDEDLTFRSTMSQKAANPGKAGALELFWRRQDGRAQPSKSAKTKARQPSKLAQTDALQRKIAKGEPLSEEDEELFRRLKPEQYKSYTRAQAAAQFKAQNEALAAEKAALEAQGKMSWYELYANAPALLKERAWLFHPPQAGPVPQPVAAAPAAEQQLSQDQISPRKSRRQSAGASMKHVLARRSSRRGDSKVSPPVGAQVE